MFNFICNLRKEYLKRALINARLKVRNGHGEEIREGYKRIMRLEKELAR